MKGNTIFLSFNEQAHIPAGTRPRAHKNTLLSVFLFFLVLALVAITPALAGTQYMAGSPDLEAHIAGTNEFSPGDDLNLQVVIENTGLNQFTIVQSGILTPTDLSNTAKQLTATLSAGGAPLVVKADPQIIGDLPASTSATATFHIKVNQDAPAGIYPLPVILNYTYLYQAQQEGSETLNYQYKTVNETIEIPIRIKSEVQIAVPTVKTENLNAGIEGYVLLTVKNIGYEDGQNAVVPDPGKRPEPGRADRGKRVYRGLPGRFGGKLYVPGHGIERCAAEDLSARRAGLLQG